MDDIKAVNVASVAINWNGLGIDPKIIVENSERVKGRFIPTANLKDEPVALVAYGPSLRDTWKQITAFDNIITCSGAHKFLVDRGIVPNYHCESDPRAHKVKMLGEPQPGCTYLMASCCHSNYFDVLEKAEARILLWHLLFENSHTDEDIYALYPKGDWIICGGNTIGPRMIRLARLSGYTNLHLFGLDGSGGHAGIHTNTPDPAAFSDFTVKGRTYNTTKQLMTQAVSLAEDLDRMPEVKCTWYGDGLYQTIFRNRTPRELARWPLAIQK